MIEPIQVNSMNFKMEIKAIRNKDNCANTSNLKSDGPRSQSIDSFSQTDEILFNPKRKVLSIVCGRTWRDFSMRESNTVEKCFWGFFLIIALLTAMILVYMAIRDFSSHTVTTNMDSLSTSFDNIHFPAITICNMNKMKLSVLQKYNLGYNVNVLDIFDRYYNIGSRHNFTDEEWDALEHVKDTIKHERLKIEGQHKCHNMFIQYSWQKKNMEFNSLNGSSMHYTQNTDENLCCQIFPGMLPSENLVKNSMSHDFWVKEKNPWQVLFDGYKSGVNVGKQGVQVMIDVETYEYFSSNSMGSEGIMVLIQHYRDIPLMRRESFTLSPGHVVDIGLSITEISTSQNAINRFTPSERDCFTAEEVNLVFLPLKNGYRMSMTNCLYDKALHAVRDECGCVPSFYVLKAMGNLSICTGSSLYCALNIFDNISNPKYKHLGTENVCRSPCDDVLYESRITMASYPNKHLFRHCPELCPIVNKILKICTGWLDPIALEEFGQYPDELKIKKKPLLNSGIPQLCDHLGDLSYNDSCEIIKQYLFEHEEALSDVSKYTKQNLLWLNIYIKDSYVTRIVRDERMTRTNFVANVGGLLGLCMGFSLISVGEIVYFLVKQQCLRCLNSISHAKTMA